MVPSIQGPSAFFAAHTPRGRIEVIDHDTSRHIATLNRFLEAAGVVADDGHALVTNSGAESRWNATA